MEENSVLSVVGTKKNKIKRGIITSLYQEGSRTIAQLAKLLHSSVPSIMGLIEELTNESWVREIGTGPAQYGRKPTLFALNPDQYVIIVVDISVHDTKLAVFNLANELVYRLDVDLRLENDYEFTDTLKGSLIKVALEVTQRQLTTIGVGVALPGLVDAQRGINFTYSKLDRPYQSFRDLLQDCFEAPTYIINDSKATILGEHAFGLARGKNHVISINIDWGVGMGIMADGKVLQGASGFAGELGHIQVQANGELCYCGKVGCLDTLTSASSLIRRVKIGLQEGRISRLAETDINSIDVETIVDHANAGDAFAVDLLTDVGTELGKGLSIVVHLFNPELIIVNGVLANAEKLISRPIEQAIDKYCLADYRNNLAIEISKLGEMAKLQGAQAYVMQCLLEQEHIP